ncbi:hypothetical protein LTS08_004582 [Lithohypha guttulata]|nr:hypothetical protein LTS08_004582 [Lithohypha guttulata]
MSAAEFNSQLSEQWRNPGDILSVLLIVGADVISTALNQFGGHTFRPIAFSFGWVAYAYTFLLKTAGRLKLEPDPDFPHILVNCRNGYIVENGSWLLGRMVKHFDLWMPAATREKVRELIEHRLATEKERAARLGESPPVQSTQAGLAVTIFEPPSRLAQGLPSRDRVYWTGIATVILQLGVAAIPWGLFATRRDTKKSFALTEGNGSQHVIIIIGNGRGLDLQDLASNVTIDQGHYLSLALAFGMVLLWTALLITTSGMKSHTWYLLAVGGIGMLQNIYVAGARRKPDAYGLRLDFLECLRQVKVMDTLYELEEKYPYAGDSLLPVFFPGQLREVEIRKWEELKRTAQQRFQDWQTRRTDQNIAKAGV